MNKIITATQFMARKVVGMILRIYCPSEKQIPDQVELLKRAIRRGRKSTVAGKKLIRRFDILIWSDERYKESDCGKTASVLRGIFANDKDVFIHEIKHGDIYCGILNYGIAHQLRYGHVDYSIIASSEAYSYMTEETFESITEAACNGARIIGVATNELAQSVLEGRVANTFAMWHNESLMTVGGFNFRVAKPIDGVPAIEVEAWHENLNRFVKFKLVGEEELITSFEMVKLLNEPCIAPVIASCMEGAEYIVPDKKSNYDKWIHHESKMCTKEIRATGILGMVNCDKSFLKGGVMPKYRTF